MYIQKMYQHALNSFDKTRTLSNTFKICKKYRSNYRLHLTVSNSQSQIGLVGLAVMGQNLALNIAEKQFSISVYNRSPEKTDLTVARAKKERLDDKLSGFYDVASFVHSLQSPRAVVLLVQAGNPVDATIDKLCKYLEPGDMIIDGGNEWYENTERRETSLEEKGILYMGMGVSGGEDGARHGPSLMPGGNPQVYDRIHPIVNKIAAQVDNEACVTYVGAGGSGNFVKMVHNGIEYGDMQLISEAYDVLKHVGGLSNSELADVFAEWNSSELQSFLIEITSIILNKTDDLVPAQYQIDSILDKTGMKGTGKWTIQQAAELSVATPTIATSLDARFLSGLKDERIVASSVHNTTPLVKPRLLSIRERQHLIADVKSALYVSKICSYAQGMNLIKAKSDSQNWSLSLAELARIWKGGCIIRAQFLDNIRIAYTSNPTLPSLLVDPYFANELQTHEEAWRRMVITGVTSGIALPSMSASLAYFDTYRRENMPANLIQAQRDFFGSHTYERNDKQGHYHTIWSDMNSSDSITTTNYS